MRSDFGLLCENYYLGAFIMSIPPSAHFFGAFISGPISDYLGRRIALILSIIGLTTFSGLIRKSIVFDSAFCTFDNDSISVTTIQACLLFHGVEYHLLPAFFFSIFFFIWVTLWRRFMQSKF